MKRFFSVFLAAALLMVLAVPASAAESYIWDEAGLLTEEGRAELNETAREISERTGCGVYFLSIPDYTVYGKDTIYDTAVWLFEQKGLGTGENKDGVLLVLSIVLNVATFFVSLSDMTLVVWISIIVFVVLLAIYTSIRGKQLDAKKVN